MAQSISGIIHKTIKDTDGKDRRYSFRTATLYNDAGGTGIVPNSARTTIQLDLGGLTGFVNIAERNAAGGWDFTPAAGALIKKELSKRGPGSLTGQMDNATLAALKSNARITDIQARQALDISQNITGTTALLPPDQNSDGTGPGGGNAPAGSDSNGSSASVTPEQSQQVIDTISKGQKARTNYESNLKYPETYEGNDFVTIEMIRYVPSKNLGLGSVASDADAGMLLNGEMGLPRIDERSQNEKSIASITLPIPANLIDANPVDWTNESLNPLQAYGASAIGGILNSGNFVKGVGAEVGKAANTLKNNADAAKTILNNEIIKQILGVNTLTRSTGAIVNPNTELLFKGPGLRTFTFSFKMTPRSQKEAVSVRKIIRTLKQGMSVKRGIQGIFLSSPNVFKIKFHYVAPEVNKDTGEVIGQKPIYPHPYLPVLKVCALQNISVNYMPDGSYMTYGDGSMVAYDMTLTFSEISPIFDDDYDELDKEVGGANSDGTPIAQDTIIGY